MIFSKDDRNKLAKVILVGTRILIDRKIKSCVYLNKLI